MSRATGSGARTPRTTRIRGCPVPPLLPADGPVVVYIIGEAPGPRGADKSGFPFFGDAAGRHLYRALREIGAVRLPQGIDDLPWDGDAFAAAGFRPVARGVALGNAYDRCPTDDGVHFRAPSREELEGEDNVARLVREFAVAQARGMHLVVTLGRVATRTIDAVCEQAPMPALTRHALPHPSAQGLLSMAPHRGKGARMADLQAAWVSQCIDVIRAGFRLADYQGRDAEQG